jgi:hypothetical protein
MGAVNLTKSRSVLDLDPIADNDRPPTFRHLDDDARSNVVSIDPDLWEDMGSPDQITVTIEPGDHLNVEPVKLDVSEVAVDAAKATLVAQAEAAGIAVDARWGVKRLTEAIAAASQNTPGDDA